ncbi:MAG TPA: hypothetical protein VHT31_10195, partial [Candidatus Acidoferrum sp.]|nr:hypothetical protein [Candidatus Acidoferrum sp.]
MERGVLARRVEGGIDTSISPLAMNCAAGGYLHSMTVTFPSVHLGVFTTKTSPFDGSFNARQINLQAGR